MHRKKKHLASDTPIKAQRTKRTDSSASCDSGRTRPHEGDNHLPVKLHPHVLCIMGTEITTERLNTDSGPHDNTPASPSPAS